ncbi:adenylate/guanylate cyclase domain-containing protein [Aestuariibaculum lutulentum]|uniref:Tetratricopeptide repeat protein n=1 Tax=Aestuariibaculum lutulentum TaxID=2920935 RepID=A0ABS9RKM8_9FLAO|nr:adenylate/guanylate cyclase domain-containing protein [Aestuariibaculum lutulentum]MCH4553061.1 tetratricopeptide repeat protein [Aestuariibaculum lutulentum]
MNLRQGLLLICIFFLLTYSGFGQNSSIDSIKRIVNSGVRDTSMVTALNAMSKAVLRENITEAKLYAEQANELAVELDFKKGKAYALNNIGLTQYFQGRYLDVLNSWTESLKEFESIHDTIGMANLVNNLGAVYYSQGSNVRAMDYYLRSLSISEKLKDPFRISSALLNIGGLYAEMQNYDKALEYYNRCNEFKDNLNDSQLIISYLMGVGEVYYKKGLYNEALYYYQEALSSNETVTLRADNLIKIGKVLLKKDEIQESIKYFDEAYEVANANNQQLLVVQALDALGEVYRKENFNKSVAAYKEAEALAKSIEANDELRDIYKGLSSTYAINSDFEKAYYYNELYVAKKDSLFNLETDDKIRGLQFDFDLEKKEDQIGLLEKDSEIMQLKQKRQKSVILVSLLTILVVFISAVGLYKRYKFVKATNLIIEQEKKRSENLLHNILPEETAVELKEKGKVEAKKFESVTVLFTDFKGFTYFAKDLSPEDLVNSVDYYFSKFDEIMEKYGIEKIKTIGDAYMCAGGLPFPTSDHPFKVIMAAFEIAQFIDESKRNAGKNVTTFDIRIGVNTGPIVAGVVGIHKFAYDIWGDTVNVASRMESLSEPGRINISENTYDIVKDVFDCKYRGEIEVKNRGIMKMFFVNGIKDQGFLDRLQLNRTAV